MLIKGVPAEAYALYHDLNEFNHLHVSGYNVLCD